MRKGCAANLSVFPMTNRVLLRINTMEAKALICDENQQFTLSDVKLKDPELDQVAIRTQYSGVSIGTEFALVRNKISWGPYPICTGYMGTGVVEIVGSDIDGFKVGDKVHYRGNDEMELTDGTNVSCASAHTVLTSCANRIHLTAWTTSLMVQVWTSLVCLSCLPWDSTAWTWPIPVWAKPSLYAAQGSSAWASSPPVHTEGVS